jgi:Mg/Co/Ni transporter MgtE
MADKNALAEHFVDILPDAAARIIEAHPPAEVSGFVDRIPDPLSGKALGSMHSYHAARSIEGLTDEAAARYLSTLTTERVTAVLRHVTPHRRRQILAALPRGLATRAGLLLNHSIRTVGAWMDPTPPAVDATLTVEEALARLKDHEGRRDPDVFLIDEEERPTGVLAIADLVWAEPTAKAAAFAKPISHKLVAASTLATAMRHVGWRRRDRLPVVDRRDRLVGVLHHVAMRRGIQRVLESGNQTKSTGDPLDLANLWYEGLAGALNAALAPTATDADEQKAE